MHDDVAIYATVRRFDQANCLQTARTQLHLPASSGNLAVGGGQFTCTFESRPARDRPDALDLTIQFRLESGSVRQLSVALELDIARWSSDNYVLFPAAAYNGNRFEVRDLGHKYPPMFVQPQDICKNPPILITDVPHLALGDGESRIQLRTGDMATPCVGFHSPDRQFALLLLTDQESRLGNFGLHVRESADRSGATITLEAPGMRTDGMYIHMNSTHPTIDRASDWDQGDSLTFRCRVFVFPASSVQGLFDRFALVRKDLSDSTAPRPRHEIPFSAAWAVQEQKYNAQNWRDAGYYAVGTDDASQYGGWQLGWVGGGMSSFPLLLAGDAQSQQRARDTIQWMLTRGQAPGGLLYGIVSRDRNLSDGFDTHPNEPWVMTRKEADGLYFLMKHFILLAQRNPLWQIPAVWRNGTLKLADALLRIWKRDGQLGQFLNYETGEILVGNSTAGAMAPAGFALAGAFFHRSDYLEAAEQIAAFYYQRDVTRGLTTGGPGEILNCPDSESAFAMLESLVVLWEVTGEAIWRDRACDMAKQACTWVHSYDYRFPPESPFAQLDMRTTGSVWANVQNKHSAPHICTLSGDALLKLYRATGDRWYLDLCRDIVHGAPQYLSRADRKVQMLAPGWMCERVNTCDWEYPWCPPGHVFDGSCWCEVANMLSYAEVPGLYVDLDAAKAVAIDHIDVEVLGKEAAGVRLRLRNPTRFDADVRVLAETQAVRNTPLGQCAAIRWPVVRVPAGECVETLAV